MPLGPVEYLEDVLGVTLYPAQRFILKMVYGERLDEQPSIETRDALGVSRGETVSEWDYLRYLHRNTRASTDTFTSMGFNTSVLCLGRRAGKNHLTALMHLYNLHLFEGMNQETFQCLHLSPTQDMSRLERENFRGLLSEHMLLQRESRDVLEVTIPGDRRVRYNFRSFGQQNRLPNGTPSDFITVQELAFEANQEGVQALQEVTSTLRQNTRLVLTSSPNGARGSFHHFYNMAMRQPEWLALRIPTWEANPSITEEFLHSMWAQDPVRYESDFAANFVDPNLLTQVFSDRPDPFLSSHDQEAPTGPVRSRYDLLLEELESYQVESVGLPSAPSDA